MHAHKTDAPKSYTGEFIVDLFHAEWIAKAAGCDFHRLADLILDGDLTAEWLGVITGASTTLDAEQVAWREKALTSAMEDLVRDMHVPAPTREEVLAHYLLFPEFCDQVSHDWEAPNVTAALRWAYRLHRELMVLWVIEYASRDA